MKNFYRMLSINNTVFSLKNGNPEESVHLIGSGQWQSKLFANAAMNYSTERVPVLAAALGPLACSRVSARPRKWLSLSLP